MGCIYGDVRNGWIKGVNLFFEDLAADPVQVVYMEYCGWHSCGEAPRKKPSQASGFLDTSIIIEAMSLKTRVSEICSSSCDAG